MTNTSPNPPLKLYDTHAHLTDPVYRDRWADVLQTARQAGLVAINVVGFDAATSRQACHLATVHPALLRATVGIQPNSAASAQDGDWDQIVRLAATDPVCGIGETGLDRYWDDTPWTVQQDYFDRHLNLSYQVGKPLVIHMRECGQEIVDQIRPYATTHGPLRGVMHSYTGDWNVCRACLDLGLMISFAGMLTFKKSADLREVARRVPHDRLLVETDCPYLSPEPFRGRRPNEPARVAHTLRCLAEVVGRPAEELAEVTTANARRLFEVGRALADTVDSDTIPRHTTPTTESR